MCKWFTISVWQYDSFGGQFIWFFCYFTPVNLNILLCIGVGDIEREQGFCRKLHFVFFKLHFTLLKQCFSTIPPLSDFSIWRWSMMRLRVRKAPQQPSLGHQNHPSQAKRKHCEVEPSPVRGRGDTMQKNETGLFSTIKKFIRGNAVKVGYFFNYVFCAIHTLYSTNTL